MNNESLKSLLPFGFIVLYGSGFVFTEYGLENSSPMIFLLSRFLIAFILLLVITKVFKIEFPKTKVEVLHIAISGMLTVGVFSIFIYLAISNNLSASLSALIIALQPILVALLATLFLKERVTLKIWLGMGIGFLGVLFVVMKNLDFSTAKYYGVVFAFISLLGLSLGNVYQKKFCSNMNIFSGGVIQTFASSLLVLPFLYNEDVIVYLNFDFFLALFYMSVCVSIGALSLLFIMIKKGEVSKVASIFYLLPIVAAVISTIFFNLDLEPTIIVGIITIVIGVTLINKDVRIKR